MSQPPLPSVNPVALRLGAAAWLLGTLQFLVVHVVVERAWTVPYSWLHNNISDLGNVGCGPWGDNARYVCSPLHTWINIALVVQGILLLSGLLLAVPLWRRGCIARGAHGFLLLAAAGWIAAGVFPADVNENLHVVLAVPTIFLGGNVGLMLTALTLRLDTARWLRVAAGVLGLGGVVALVLFFNQTYLGLGMGGMERVTAYPLPLWLVLAGLYLLCTPAVQAGWSRSLTAR